MRGELRCVVMTRGILMRKIIEKTLPQWLVYGLLFLPFMLGALEELLGVPRAVGYLLDVAWGTLLVLMVWKGLKEDLRESRFLVLWVAAFFGYTLITYMFRYQSPLYYLWGFRNNFRFYVVFFAFVLFLTPNAVEKILEWFDILFWVNFAASLVQCFGFGIWQDWLGGIFGTQMGVNGWTTIFFVIVLAKSMLFYLNDRESAWLCAAKCAAALLVSALAELKFFNVAFLMMAGLAVLFSGIDWQNLFSSQRNRKKYLFLALCFAGSLISSVAVGRLYPSFQNWFMPDQMLEIVATEKGYTWSNDLNRLTAIPKINKLWLTEWNQRIFGLGLGNTDTASFAFLNTPFFEEYGDMHYNWFSYAIMYLECGLIGLLFYWGFFGWVFLAATKYEKQCKGNAAIYCCMARIAAPLCCLISVYNSSLRIESAYMMFFVLALPFIFRMHRS